MANNDKPGFLERIIGSRPPTGVDSTAESSLDHYQILQHTHPDVPSPTQPPNWHSLRSHCPINSPQYFEEIEASNLEDRAKELKAMAQASKRAYKALKSIDESDIKVELAHYAYLETLAKNEGKRLGAKTRVGKALHGLRPLFDRYASQLEVAEAKANSRIEANRAKLAARMVDLTPTIDVTSR